jgi:phage FluMu protein Com
MKLTDKISYIKGLADGLKLDESKDEVKVLNQIIELLDDMAQEVDELGEFYDEAADRIEELDEELCDLEDALLECCDEDDDDECDCCGHNDEDDENPLYEVTCPECGEKLVVDEEQLLYGEVDCPKCDTTLEFDFSDLFDEEHSDDCSCGCHCDEHYGEDDLMS